MQDIRINRSHYEDLKKQGYAGPGRPLDASAPGYWYTAWENGTGTVLYTGVKIHEDQTAAA